jgi:ornithine--oxo-acid transaminase
MTARTDRAVLMGAPDHFSIRAGANPHTRTAWGLRKRVERDRAVAQWHALARTLLNLGATVFVIAADPHLPGLVYPANAGVLLPVDAALPIGEKRFVLSNLIPSRAGEKPVYGSFVRALGYRTEEISSRFEGEADFFPVGDDLYFFTYGRIVEQRFELRWGLPPWRRRYGFRSEAGTVRELARWVSDREILPLELRLEAFYHGDTCLAGFGPGRRFVLAYLDALTPASQRLLRERMGDRLIPLEEADAALYAANSFRLATPQGEKLLLPSGISARLLDTIRSLGVEPMTIDVSEFWRKGGGSVKCMIGDLGPLGEADADPALVAERERRRYLGTQQPCSS